MRWAGALAALLMPPCHPCLLVHAALKSLVLCLLLPARCRKIANPRILLLDCPLEYKKGENQTNVELMKEEDW